MSRRPVCVKCQTEMRCAKNEVVILDMTGRDVYKGWFADMYECPGCGVQVVSGFAEREFTEHWQPEHASRMEKIKKMMEPRHIIKNFEKPQMEAEVAR